MSDTLGSHWTDAHGLVVLDRDECRDLLASVRVGRLAYCHEGVPRILPVNHTVDGWDIVFRSGYGHKLRAAVGEAAVAFEADAFDGETGAGWSVVATGRIEHVTDVDLVTRFETLEGGSWAPDAQEGRWIRVRVEELSGRRLPTPG